MARNKKEVVRWLIKFRLLVNSTMQVRITRSKIGSHGRVREEVSL
jgi:hypothetical protein